MKLYRSTIYYFVFAWLMLGSIFLSGIQAQNGNILFHSHLSDELVSYQSLPDGGIRVFAITRQTNGYDEQHGLFTDIHPGQPLNEIVFKNFNVEGSEINTYANELFSLSLKTGATILGTNQFDCDYGFPGGVCLIDPDGNVEWVLDFNQAEVLVYITKMVFIDTNAILLNDEFIIDRDGNILTINPPATSYDETIETSYGYLARRFNHIDILSPAFKIVRSYNLDQDIKIVQPLGKERFMIRTEGKFYELDQNAMLTLIPLTANQYQDVWKSYDFYWAKPLMLPGVVQFDTLFNPIDTISIPPGVHIRLGIYSSLEHYVITEYTSDITKGILVFKGPEEQLEFNLPQDIGITGILIPDTVRIYKSGYPILGWTFRFDSVRVEVTNFGVDTVFHYEIQAVDELDCGFCFEINKIWKIYTPLAPGSTASIPLGAFNPRCVPYKNSPLCISTIGPDSKADGNVENDKFCQTISNSIVSTSEISMDRRIKVYPNPADDEIVIQIDQHDNSNIKGSILNSYGKQVESFTMTDDGTAISVAIYPQGMYFINFTNGEQHTLKKFVVIH